MPPPLRWTDDRDMLLCTMRENARSWDAIAAALGISRWAAIERAKLLGAHIPLPAHARAAQGPLHDPAREALPAGHPITWGALVAGTLLDGAPYPFPRAQDDEPAQDLAA